MAGPAALGIGGSVRVAPRTRAPPVATASAAQMDGRQVLPAPALALFGAVPSLQPNGKFAVGVPRCSSSSGSFFHVYFKLWKPPSSGPTLATISHLPSSSCCSLARHVTTGSVLSRRNSVAFARASTVPVWLPHTPRPSALVGYRPQEGQQQHHGIPSTGTGCHCCWWLHWPSRGVGLQALALCITLPMHVSQGRGCASMLRPRLGRAGAVPCWGCAGGACSPSVTQVCGCCGAGESRELGGTGQGSAVKHI